MENTKKEWIKEYHTIISGTTLKIIVEYPYITIKAIEKPYKISVHVSDLQELIRQGG